MKRTKRKNIRKIPLSEAIPARQGVCYCTMSIGQWDDFLCAAYDCGYVLIELDDEERPVAAYMRPPVEGN